MSGQIEYCNTCKYQQCFLRGMINRSITCQREKDDALKWDEIQKDKLNFKER